jgi:polysaccharide deacetylase 2 family uncharacterized protein YibQ
MAGREGTRKPVRRQGSFRTVALLMLVPIAGCVVFFGYRYLRDQLIRRPQAGTQERASMVAPSKTGGVVSRSLPPPPAEAASPTRFTAARAKNGHGAIVLILDDVGFDRQPLVSAMAIDPNISFSILPNSGNAAAFADELHHAGFEILCHLPMEPLNYPRESPGPNAIMMAMDDARIAEVTRENVAAVPYVVGVNNHMGSRATRDPRVMTAVLKALPAGMFFIDSRTTSGSVGERLAREMKIPTASRHVFLDDVQSEAAVRQQLANLAAAANRDGVSIGIGHMYPVTIRVLSRDVPELRAAGYRFVRATEAVR